MPAPVRRQGGRDLKAVAAGAAARVRRARRRASAPATLQPTTHHNTPPPPPRAVKKVALAVFLFLAGFSMLAGGLYIWYTQPGEGRGALQKISSDRGGSTQRCWQLGTFVHLVTRSQTRDEVRLQC